MIRTAIFLFFSLTILFSANAQRYLNSKKPTRSTAKGNIFFYWGYNRSVYTKSDLRLIGTGYDITMRNAEAHDNPYPFSAENYFNIERITIPQFNIRAGYFFKDHWSISLGYDHMKYIFKGGNRVQLHGFVKPGIDTVTNLSGDYHGEEMVTDRNTFHYENSDGLNFIRLEATRHYELLSQGKKNQFVALASTGVSAGAVVSVNDLNFMGTFDRTTRSLSGYGISSHLGLRLEFFRHLFIQTTLSGGMIHQLRVLNRPNDRNAYSKQVFGYSELSAVVGANFRIKGKKDCDCPKW
jgi:hypothetical protein